MSNGSLNKIEKVDEIRRLHGRKGIQKLIVFKLVKMRVGQYLSERHSSLPADEELNKLCMEAADNIIEKGRENPSEEDIRSLIRSLFEIREGRKPPV